MSKISDEISLLKTFRARFSTTASYKKALGDILAEGMITRTAYNKVMEDLSAVKKKSTKKLKRSYVTKAIKKVVTSPCEGRHC